jgi:phosphate transport system protein
MLEEKLSALKKDLIEYASLAEDMLKKSVKGLLEKDKAVLEEVIKIDEPKANEWEIRIDEDCTVLIAQFQPAAKDLRAALMILKMNNDLERLGDHAVNIAQSAQYLIERPLVKPYIDIPNMSKLTQEMLKDSITAFVNGDASLAKDVCERDNQVDDLKDQILRELITFMVSDSSTIERALHLMRISGNLERIADLSTNICEDVIFMVEGRVIKHNVEEE